MAINYTKVGWDTSKYVNPTNMNQMDDGIKAACDGVDALDTEIDTKLNISGGTMSGNLTVNRGTSGYSNISIGGTNTGTYFGNLSMYRAGYELQLNPAALTNTRVITFPDKNGILALTNETVNLGDSLDITLPSGYYSDIQNNKIKILGSGIAAVTFSIKKSDNGVIAVTNIGTLPSGYVFNSILPCAYFDTNNAMKTGAVFFNTDVITLINITDAKRVFIGGVVTYL